MTAKDQRHLKLGLIASTTTVERLSVNFRDRILSRVGLVMALQVDFSDAAFLARNLVPTETIYASTPRSAFK